MTSRMTTDHDAVVVGASLAGCAAAVALARQGVRVALLEQRPDPEAFKRICGHFIQASAVPALERLGFLEPMLAAGAVRSGSRIMTAYGLVHAGDADKAINLRRERLDPLVRGIAARTEGVELVLGERVDGLVRRDGAVAGVEAVAPSGARRRLRAGLVVAADGRDSRVAGLGDLPERRWPNARFSYGAYYEGPPPAGAPDGTIWFLDPEWGAAFPTDDGLTLYAAMPLCGRVAEFKRDPVTALEAFVSALPDAPPLDPARRVSDAFGRIDLTNVARGPVAPGLALVGDAALATDPLWGVGCGWAFQTAEWLADAVAPALRGEEPLERGLRRYARAHRRRIGPHARLIHRYATGRRFDAGDRLVYWAGARDERVASAMAAFGSRSIAPSTMVRRVLPRALALRGRTALRVAPRPMTPAAAAPRTTS